ncbi:ABC transporter permease [Streptomyces sp. SID4912]|nr:ABC transporter permease [Streptomyces sp. SID4912]
MRGPATSARASRCAGASSRAPGGRVPGCRRAPTAPPAPTRAVCGAAGALGAFGLPLLFRFATSWVGYWLGLLIRDEEAAGQVGSATFVLPLLSSAYIPTGGMPGRVRTVAERNPISALAAATRELFGNAAPAADAAWPSAHPVAGTLAWAAVLLAVFVPLTVRRYARDGKG